MIIFLCNFSVLAKYLKTKGHNLEYVDSFHNLSSFKTKLTITASYIFRYLSPFEFETYDRKPTINYWKLIQMKHVNIVIRITMFVVISDLEKARKFNYFKFCFLSLNCTINIYKQTTLNLSPLHISKVLNLQL